MILCPLSLNGGGRDQAWATRLINYEGDEFDWLELEYGVYQPPARVRASDSATNTTTQKVCY